MTGTTWAAAVLCAGCTLLGFGGSVHSAATGEDGPAWEDAEAGFSRESQITPATIGRLGLAWAIDLPDEKSLEATPVVAGGMLYVTGSHAKVYAADIRTGTIKWTYDPEVYRHTPEKLNLTFAINRGVAYDDGKVFVGTLDGRLIALDAKSGKPVWTAQTLPAKSASYISGAPRIFRGKVIIGFGGGDYGTRGYVSAYDAKTGKQAWRFYTVPGSPEQNAGDPVMARAAETWGGEYWKTGTGGAVWNGITVDPELNRVYIGTSNGSPYDPNLRSPGGGDNLFLCSIVALDADTGQYIWHYQANPREGWDYKAVANMVAATLSIDGKPRKVLMQAPTNGFFYVLDRETGKLVSAGKTGKINWAERIDLKTGRPVESPKIRYETGEVVMFPGPMGGHNWQQMSYSPETRLAYIPYTQIGARYSNHGDGGGEGVVKFGGFSIAPVIEDKEDGKGALIAWDPVAQKARWKVQFQYGYNGGTAATAGGIVFEGRYDGTFSAYDAENGKNLWNFDAQFGIVGAPVSYELDGRQYVSILVGAGGTISSLSSLFNVGWKFNAPTRRLLTFALDGKAKLPPAAPRSKTLAVADDPSFVVDVTKAKQGAEIFAPRCSACHGTDAVSVGVAAPDLRESAVPLNLDAFRSVVVDGALLPRGMPSFADLTDEQLRTIQHYIRARARLAAAKH